MSKFRMPIIIAALSATGFSGILAYEGFSDHAYQPVPGDRWTIGFGTTGGVKEGDVIDPSRAVDRAARDAEVTAQAIKACIKVPVSQGEFDAYVSLAYNIGTKAFCESTLVKKLNQEDYDGACREINRWVYFRGSVLPGLVTRRQAEYERCIGEANAKR